jgi:hypothetical protein
MVDGADDLETQANLSHGAPRNPIGVVRRADLQFEVRRRRCVRLERI